MKKLNPRPGRQVDTLVVVFVIAIAHIHMLLGIGPRPFAKGRSIEHDGVEGMGGVEMRDVIGVAHGFGGTFEATLGGVGQGKVLFVIR